MICHDFHDKLYEYLSVDSKLLEAERHADMIIP